MLESLWCKARFSRSPPMRLSGFDSAMHGPRRKHHSIRPPTWLIPLALKGFTSLKLWSYSVKGILKLPEINIPGQTIYPCNFSYSIRQASVLLQCMEWSLLVGNNVSIHLNNKTSIFFFKTPKKIMFYLKYSCLTSFRTCGWQILLYS